MQQGHKMKMLTENMHSSMKLLTFGLAFVNFYAVSGTSLRKVCPFASFTSLHHETHSTRVHDTLQW